MEWSELSDVAQNVLERCWISSFSDRATTFEVVIGKELYDEHNKVTLSTLDEILKFQQSEPYFNVQLLQKGIQQSIKVTGAYKFHEWDDFDNTLTENGAKEELAVDDYVYAQYSHDIANIHRFRITKVNQKTYVLENFLENDFHIDKNQLTPTTTKGLNRHGQVFLSRETVYLQAAYERLQVENHFEELFDLKTVSTDTLQQLIMLLEQAEENE